MDMHSFFGSPKWAILEILSLSPSSPVEISEKTENSVSYVSQQLKLLEAAGLVVKVKTKSFEKGKPRVIYSINKEVAEITALIKTTPGRKTIYLDEHQKTILRIWLFVSKSEVYSVERFYWKVEEELSKKDILLYSSNKGKPEIDVFGTGTKLENICKKYSDSNLAIRFFDIGDFKLDFLKGKQIIFGNLVDFSDSKDMKGGNE